MITCDTKLWQITMPSPNLALQFLIFTDITRVALPKFRDFMPTKLLINFYFSITEMYVWTPSTLAEEENLIFNNIIIQINESNIENDIIAVLTSHFST